MKPQRQFVTPRTPRYRYRIRPLFFGDRFPILRRLPLRVSLLILSLGLMFWLGIISGSAWVTSHPCLSVPRSKITGVILGVKSLGPLGENRQDIACGSDGKVKWATMYISAEEIKP